MWGLLLAQAVYRESTKENNLILVWTTAVLSYYSHYNHKRQQLNVGNALRLKLNPSMSITLRCMAIAGDGVLSQENQAHISVRCASSRCTDTALYTFTFHWYYSEEKEFYFKATY
jgi:hypothetical protein